MHPLTEKEIQEKLYGSYNKPGGYASGLPSSSSPVSSGGGRPGGTASEGELSLGHQPKVPGQKETLTTEISELTREEQRQQREKRKERERAARIKEWADEEVEALNQDHDKSWYEPPSRIAPTPGERTAAALRGIFSQLKPVVAGVRTFLGWVVKILVGGLLGLLQQISRLKFLHARRVLYWASGVSFLLILFWAIHFLNVQREAAMKMPRKSLPASAGMREGNQVLQTSSREGVSEPNGVSSNNERPGPNTNKPSADAPEETTVQKPAAGGVESPFVIQVATFARQGDAERLVRNLEEAGIASFVRALRSASGRTYYSVFLGGYRNYQEAQRELEAFRRKDIAKPFPDAFIRTLKVGAGDR